MYPPLFIVLIACVTSLLGNSSRNSKCFQTICPAIKATICVKVKPKNEPLNYTRYVLMSKCELNQTKCFNDVKTTVVLVKFCNATSLRDGAESDESNLSEIEKQISEIKNQSNSGLINEYQVDKDKAPLSDGEAQDDEPPEKSEQTPNNEVADDTSEPLEETTNDARSKEEAPTEDPSYYSTNTEEPEPEEIHKELDGSDETASESQAEEKSDSEKQKLDNGNSADNGEECPQKCPTGDVMVCARCSHRIYRTFMSLCYMRMYQCHNPNEKLELVTRHACQGSAPYLGEMARPKNNLVLQHDDDPVLNYIFAAQDSGHPKSIT